MHIQYRSALQDKRQAFRMAAWAKLLTQSGSPLMRIQTLSQERVDP
jgi:hypothetical protein